MAKVALLGHGVVGSGTAEILMTKAEQLCKRAGESVELKYVLVRHSYDVDYTDKFVSDFSVIENDNDVDIVVEVIGGLDPAYDYVKRRLTACKNVVTSNKELVAEYGAELMKTAKEKNVNFLFEGAVAGAIPVIHSVRNCLEANEVKSVSGILNGTTNYILTKMIYEGLSFDVALKQAQELGYAEADPSADVDGIDTCRKICILADIITGSCVKPSQVHTEGIRNVRIKDVDILKAIGGQIKLLGHFEKTEDDKLFIIVSPFVVLGNGVLTAANDVFNAVEIETDNAGIMGFFGRGAGSLPTGSAVVNDIVECVKSGNTIYEGWNDAAGDNLADYRTVCMDFYVNVADSTEKILEIFPEAQIIADNDEKSFIIRSVSEEALTVKLGGFTVNSVLRVAK